MSIGNGLSRRLRDWRRVDAAPLSNESGHPPGRAPENCLSRVICEGLEQRVLFASYGTADYFPVAPGLSWDYSGTYSDSQGVNGTATDLKTTAADSVNGVPVTRFDDMPTVFGQSAGTASRYYAFNANGLAMYGQSNGGVIVTLSQPLLIMHSTAQDGDVISWSNVGLTASGSSQGVSVFGTGTDSGTSTVVGSQTITLASGQSVATVEVVLNHTESYNLVADGQIATETAQIQETFWLAKNFGIAQFTGNVSVTASADGSQVTETIAESFSTTDSVPVGQPTQLVINQQPTNAIAGIPTTPPITVTVADSDGNGVATDNSSVTLTILSGPSGGTLGGSSSVTVQAINGVATFTGLVLTTREPTRCKPPTAP